MLGEIYNEYTVSSPVSLTNSHSKSTSWVELLWLKELCVLGNLNTEHTKPLPSISTKWPTISKPSSEYNSTYSKNFVSQKTWTINLPSVFHSVTNEWPFHNHLASRALPNLELCVLGDMNNECAVSSPVSLVNGYFRTYDYNSTDIKSSVS